MDLSYLLDQLTSDPFFKKFRHLNEKLAEVIQDYSLVSFVPLNVQVSQTVKFNTPKTIKNTQKYSIINMSDYAFLDGY